MRGVDDQRARARGDGGGQAVKVGPEAARRQRHAHGRRARQADAGQVAVVAGFEHDDFVAGLRAAKNGGEDGLRGSGGDGDFALGAVSAAVKGLKLCGNGLAQRGHARHGGVLVVACSHGLGHGVSQRGVAGKVGKALAEVDGLVPRRQRGHGAEDVVAHAGQARFKGRKRGSGMGHGGTEAGRPQA